MKKESSCLHCKKVFIFETSSKKGKFCNNNCQAQYRFENITIKRIESNECREAVTLKNYLAKVREYKCEMCKIDKWCNKPVSLHLDHIDGNSDNNYPVNLRLLCPNCHSQTETFCGRNKKNSKRSLYNQRYRVSKLRAH